VKIHHPSDVVGGAVTGLALAALLRPAIQHLARR
jgi:membrane-associated phospholipid phosphatase